MNPVLVTILVCLAGVPREQCDDRSAVDSWAYEARSELDCADAMRQGQIHFSTPAWTEGMAAQTSTYIATRCERLKPKHREAAR